MKEMYKICKKCNSIMEKDIKSPFCKECKGQTKLFISTAFDYFDIKYLKKEINE